jgi:hypothetical protein
MQLDEMMRKLAIKQPKLINRSAPLLLHDNARPHTGWEKIMGNIFSQQHFSKYRSATLSEYFIRTLKVIINIK